MKTVIAKLSTDERNYVSYVCPICKLKKLGWFNHLSDAKASGYVCDSYEGDIRDDFHSHCDFDGCEDCENEKSCSENKFEIVLERPIHKLIEKYKLIM